jgi:hypothetical protein
VRDSAPLLPRSPSAGPVGTACLRAAQPIGGPGKRRALHAPPVVRSDCRENKLSGTIGSWIGSMAKLTYL